ncbi:hypothetical protein O181_128245 [Austropuccinia psidii MF-1]|uniref:Uncharacterized protein n=1 Tax=Austropuccinia psidii MF-1 TaxID=1389203 RepID=A0A9Q3Q8U0_9BASI|nr:hypothetical protein [Austropuccinia psidii MF-1]
MGFKHQSTFYFSPLTHFSSINNTDSSSSPLEQKTPNPPQQDSPIPCMPCKQPLWQSTPGMSGTQWSEELFHGKQQHAIPFLILTFESSELTLPPFLDPSQQNYPPITGLSQA